MSDAGSQPDDQLAREAVEYAERIRHCEHPSLTLETRGCVRCDRSGYVCPVCGLCPMCCLPASLRRR